MKFTEDMKIQEKIELGRAEISERYFRYLMSGERSASREMGKYLEQVWGVSRCVWICAPPEQRRAAWAEYITGKCHGTDEQGNHE